MTSSRITLGALLAFALVACGGGGTGEGGDPQAGIPGPEQPTYNDQAPPGNPDAPVDSYDPVPNSSDQPGGTPGGGGGTSNVLGSRTPGTLYGGETGPGPGGGPPGSESVLGAPTTPLETIQLGPPGSAGRAPGFGAPKFGHPPTLSDAILSAGERG